MGEADERRRRLAAHAAADVLGRRRGDLAQLPEPGQHVAVGREVAAVRDEHAAAGRCGRSAAAASLKRLTVTESQTITSPLARAEHGGRQLVADRDRQLDPVVPAADQAPAPVVVQRRDRV